MGKIELKPRTKIDQKRRVLIPKWIADTIGFKSGDIIEIEVYDGKVLLTKLG